MLINELKAMAIFAEVVKRGSFREAAKSLSLSPSVVSYHIAQLENKTGAALLYRSTRKLTLSHDGEVFYQQVLKMLDAASCGIELISYGQNEPRGQLKLSLPTGLSNSIINDRVSTFALKYPKINLDIDYSDTRNNIIDERVDLTIRAGELEDSEFKSTKIGVLERILVCTPAFYMKYAVPKSPYELETWQWLKLAQLPNKRIFLSSGRSQVVEFDSQITVNSVEAIYHYCLNGLGLAVLAKSQVKNAIHTGQLMRVLPDWDVAPLPLHAIWPKNITQGSIVKLLLSHLKS